MGRPAAKLNGKRIGRLTVIEQTTERTGAGHVVWKCKCSCGKVVNVPSCDLSQSKVLSCGCWRSERMKNIRTYTGEERP